MQSAGNGSSLFAEDVVWHRSKRRSGDFSEGRPFGRSVALADKAGSRGLPDWPFFCVEAPSFFQREITLPHRQVHGIEYRVDQYRAYQPACALVVVAQRQGQHEEARDGLRLIVVHAREDSRA